jgi:hypothetical protein
VCAMRSGQGGGAANESFVIDHLWAWKYAIAERKVKAARNFLSQIES